MSERYELMLAEKADFPVTMTARLLGVSRSGFRSWLARRAGPDPWAPLAEEVARVHEASKGRFGARKVHAVLQGGPFAGVTPCRVRKAMRGLRLRGKAPNARKKTTVPDPRAAARPDLLRRDFSSPVPTCRLVGDITYLRAAEGWLYLSVVIGLATRMVVGWAASERMTADIVTEAPERARLRGYVARGAIFHSDRGSQHASRMVARWADAHGVRLSCGRTGSCHDNAVALGPAPDNAQSRAAAA